MRVKKIALVFVAAFLLLSLFFPWVVVPSRNLVISGMQADGTTYGKPGMLTLILGSIVLLFSLVPRIWAHRLCIMCSALNAGWALRNFIMLSTCQGGECPQRQPFFYAYFVGSLVLLVLVLLQEQQLKPDVEAA